MAVKRRKSKRKAPLTVQEAAWLCGDNKNDGFMTFGENEVLQKLWDDHGDKENFKWIVGDKYPQMKP